MSLGQEHLERLLGALVAGIELEGRIVFPDRSLQLTPHFQQDAEVKMRGGVKWVVAQR